MAAATGTRARARRRRRPGGSTRRSRRTEPRSPRRSRAGSTGFGAGTCGRHCRWSGSRRSSSPGGSTASRPRRPEGRSPPRSPRAGTWNSRAPRTPRSCRARRASRKCSRSSCVAEGSEAFRLDRAQLRASFDRASASYESASELQTRVATELLERLAAFDFLPAVVLALGAGPGRLTRELKRRYRRALVIAPDLSAGMLREALRHQRPWRRFERVSGDALRLPLADASVDVVFSSLMLQWCEPLSAALAEVRRVLEPD